MFYSSKDPYIKVSKTKIKKLAKERGKELGLHQGSREWLKMRKQIKNELLGEDDKLTYIAPKLCQTSCKRDGYTNLFSVKYTLKSEDGEDEQQFSVIADNSNIKPSLIKWGMKHRNNLISNATPSEVIVKNILHAIKRLAYSFQKPFIICDQLYFADFYLPDHKSIIEVDGGYHNNPDQIIKDCSRSAFLNSAKIRMYRISNEEASDTDRVYQMIYTIISDSRKILAKRTKKHCRKNINERCRLT